MALALDGELAACEILPQRESSRQLVPAIGSILKVNGLAPGDLDGLLALQGPGSFTGLRVGLATILGLHQATGVPAQAVPTLLVLAAAAGQGPRLAPRLAIVDAYRGGWFSQRYLPSSSADELPRAGDEPARRSPAGLREQAGGGVTVVGFGAAALEGKTPEEGPWPEGTSFLEPPPLAGVAALLDPALPTPWSATTLSSPLYLHPPAVQRKTP